MIGEKRNRKGQEKSNVSGHEGEVEDAQVFRELRSHWREHPAGSNKLRGLGLEKRRQDHEILGGSARKCVPAEDYKHDDLPSDVCTADPEHAPDTITRHEVLLRNNVTSLGIGGSRGIFNQEQARRASHRLFDHLRLMAVNPR